MRKYKRLCLILIVCLSIVLMFIYRQKYTKLSLLFEMINSFQCQDSDIKYNKKLFAFKESLKLGFHEKEQIAGVPYWTEIFPGIYIYSSYWISKMTRTLCFVENVPPQVLKEIHCKLSYKNKDQPVESKMNVIFIEKKNWKLFLYLECVPSFHNEVPHSVTFVHKNLTSTAFLYGMNEFYSSCTICVKPLYPAFSHIHKLLEFIIYHSQIGVKYFVFYERGLSVNAKRLLIDIAIKDDVYILLLPWNAPLNAQLDLDNSEVAFLDCYHRLLARNNSNIVLNLDIDNYIVPKENWSLDNLRADHNSPISVFKFHQKIFCTEYQSDIFAFNLNIPFVTLLKTKYLNDNNDLIEVGFDLYKSKNNILNSIGYQLWLYQKSTRRANIIPKVSVVLHSYKTCNVESGQAIEDRSIWKYKNNYFKSHIYLLAKKENLFND